MRGLSADVIVEASGEVAMTAPKINAIGRQGGSGSASVQVEGANVTIHEGATIKALSETAPQSVEITATSGDVSIARIALNTDIAVTIAGENVTIGLAQSGKTPRSKLTQKDDSAVEILAANSLLIDNLRLASGGDVLMQSAGTTVDVLDSTLKGRKAEPTFEVSGGPGSTCDLTGTTVTSATLVTNCDTVVGP